MKIEGKELKCNKCGSLDIRVNLDGTKICRKCGFKDIQTKFSESFKRSARE